MSSDVVVLLICGGVWALHAVRLVRAPWRTTWPALLIVAAGAGTSVAAYLLVRSVAPQVAVGAVVGLLIVPALAVRSSSRALRFGHIRRARALARLAAWLRPLAVQRRFCRAIEVTWRLSSGHEVDFDEALRELEVVRPVERAAHRVAFQSWTNDFEAMAAELAVPEVRAFALRGGMAAIVTTVVGETAPVAELVALYAELAPTRSLSRRTLDSAGALVATAAYLGDAETVERFAPELRRDLPAERVAFMLATAQQRAGKADDAERTIAAVIGNDGVSVSGRARLAYRREHPLDALSALEVEMATTTLVAVCQRLRARRALAPLALDLSRRAPSTWGMALALTAVFVWQSSRARRAVFDAWGLIAPYADAADPERLLSYAMLHVDTGHLVVNVLGLLIFGRFVEEHYGLGRWWLIYVLGALAGGLAFLLTATSSGVAIGASGAVLALFGATVGRIVFDRELRSSTQGKREVRLLALIAVGQLFGDLLIAQTSGSAHAGGFVAGFVLSGLLRKRAP